MQPALAGILALAAVILCGCAAATTRPTPAATAATIDDAAQQQWRKTGDYYALLEIVDAHIDPQWNGKVSKADVTKYLGEGIHGPDGYPNAGPNLWVYNSTRSIPANSILLVEFADDGFVKDVSWVSE